jgi:hypothetical protein
VGDVVPKLTPAEQLTKAVAADLDRLALYRLDRNLTFDALALEMRRAGYPVPARVLHLALTHRLTTVPRERTRYRISGFLAGLNGAVKRRLAKVRRARAAA